MAKQFPNSIRGKGFSKRVYESTNEIVWCATNEHLEKYTNDYLNGLGGSPDKVKKALKELENRKGIKI